MEPARRQRGWPRGWQGSAVPMRSKQQAYTHTAGWLSLPELGQKRSQEFLKGGWGNQRQRLGYVFSTESPWEAEYRQKSPSPYQTRSCASSWLSFPSWSTPGDLIRWGKKAPRYHFAQENPGWISALLTAHSPPESAGAGGSWAVPEGATDSRAARSPPLPPALPSSPRHAKLTAAQPGAECRTAAGDGTEKPQPRARELPVSLQTGQDHWKNYSR